MAAQMPKVVQLLEALLVDGHLDVDQEKRVEQALVWALEYRKKTLVEVRKLREDLVRAEVDRDRHQNARAQAERLSRGRYEALEALLGSDGVEVARQLVEDGMPYGDAAVAAQRLTAPKGVTR